MPNQIIHNYSIFIVEDDPWYGKILEHHLSLNPEYKITRLLSGADCIKNLHLRPDLICLDFSLPDSTGDKVYQKIREHLPDVPVIIISAQEDINIALNLLKMGVNDYLVKDSATKDLLWNSIIRIKENQTLKQEVEYLKEELGQKFSFENTILGQSEGIKKIFGLIEKASKTNINVSITGETGTGKEMVAKAIHYNSPRRKKKFVALNMAAIPNELIESELFGYERGAFTGANTRKTGKFEEANGGTIFLDEIVELNLNLQSKILRAIQEREVTRLGGNEVVKFDARLIISTHKNIGEEVKKGNFREDLYYRIIGLPIELPPLRNRGSDILILAKHFADDFVRINKMNAVVITKSAKDKLLKYHYPGNVRELKALMDLAVVMCENDEITAADITFNSLGREDIIVMEEKSLRVHICDIIRFYLNKNNQDVITTAKALEIGKSTIYKMIKDGEIEP